MKSLRFIPGLATVIALILLVTVAVTWNIQTNDTILLPAPPRAIDASVLTVAGHPAHPGRGTLYMTFVYEEQANLLTEFYQQHFNPDATIEPPQVVYGTSAPTQKQKQQQQQENIHDMAASKESAQIAAFNELGYCAGAGEHVAVAEVLKGSGAVGKLQAGDVILSANGHSVCSREQLVHVIQALRPGVAVALLVARTTLGVTHRLHVGVTLTRNAQTGQILIGIVPSVTFSSDPRLPFKVTFNTSDIEGPSAGLMFALSIINRLSPTDLTHGYKIAGTGTIDPNGYVGPIGGAKQKVIGAREAGAKYFFVPAYCVPGICNYKEAKPYAKGMTLVPVNTLDDALAFLRKLH